MTNRELVELLNESYGKNGLGERAVIERIKKRRKALEDATKDITALTKKNK